MSHAAGMTARRFILDSLRFHRSMHVALMLGIAAATAVLTGALIVGDSVRGSLRDLALDRLGRVDAVLVTDRFFRPAVAPDAVPIVMLEGSVAMAGYRSRANHVTMLGIDARFDQLRNPGDEPLMPPADGQIVLNETLARELDAQVGQDVLVHLPRPSFVPRDSPLGRKLDTIENRRLTIVRIVPARGLGHFALAPHQQEPLVAFLPLAMLQDALDQPERVNALLFGQGQPRPELEDFGLHVDQTGDYFNLTSDRMLLDPPAVEAAMQDFDNSKIQPVFTYLANWITARPGTGDEKKYRIPYSTIAALDVTSEPPLGPFLKSNGEPLTTIGDDQIVLNRWAVDDLAAQGVEVQIGDPIEITYFEPESTHGQVRERSTTLTLAAIVEMQGAAVDRRLTPDVKGVTDEESIADWDPPFPYDPSRVRSTPPNDQDEKYWDEYRATPKAFVNLKTGRRLWGSRFGDTTSLRIPAEGLTLDEVRDRWRPDPVRMGFELRSIRQQILAASGGTTPFEGLFLGFSLFIIAAAVMLIVLLFRLNLERRSREAGILLAAGVGAWRVRRLLLIEGAVVAKIGGLVGVALGVGYAAVMLAGLRTWWLAAVTTPLLVLHVEPLTLAIGYVSGVLVSLAAIVWASRRWKHATTRSLLSGRIEEDFSSSRGAGRWSTSIAAVSLVLAVLASLSGRGLRGEAQAGAFFGAGFLVLVAGLAIVRWRLTRDSSRSFFQAGNWPLLGLAIRNASRHPGRSTLTLGLIATATFLIAAIAAFHVEPPPSPEQKDSGTGGFTLVAESDQSIYQNLDTRDGREELGFSDAQLAKLDPARVASLRVEPGDDASCLNLYQVRRPQVLGATPTMIQRGGFDWAAISADANDAEQKNPWLLLDRKLDGHGEIIVPVVIDAATAIYSLHLPGRAGARYTIDDGRGGKLTLEVVGLLKNSILQGNLIIAEKDFLRHFPDAEGYRFFLIDTPLANREQVEATLESVLGNYGFAVERSDARLAGYLAVQNTYLATFQSLGALGLLLGTFGLAVVQLRNVLERRGELALLRAAGFRRSRLAWIVMLENGSLLVGGLMIGIVAAWVAISPQLISHNAAIPWASLGAMFAIVLIVGLAAGLLAVRAVLKAPLLRALREE